jgi:hypothetical protein
MLEQILLYDALDLAALIVCEGLRAQRTGCRSDKRDRQQQHGCKRRELKPHCHASLPGARDLKPAINHRQLASEQVRLP